MCVHDHARVVFVCQENYASRAKIGAVPVRSFSLFQSKSRSPRRSRQLSSHKKQKASAADISSTAFAPGTVFEVLFRRVDRLIARRMEFAVHSGMSGGPAPSGIVKSIRAAMRAFGRVDASVGIGVQVTVRAGVRAG